MGLLVAVLVFGLQIRRNVSIFDEGLALDGSVRVAKGEIPYRDFWTMYGPASFYLVAGAFHAFPVSMFTMRAIWVALKAIVAVETLVLAWALGGWRSAGLAFCLTLGLTTTVHPNHGYPAIPALAGALAAVLALATLDRPFLAGLLIGVTALFRHDFAFCVSAACLVVLLVRVWEDRRAGLIGLGKTALGVAVPTLPVTALLLCYVGVSPLLEQLFLFPSTLPRYARLSIFAGLSMSPRWYRDYPDVPVKLLALATFVGLLATALVFLVRAVRLHHPPRDPRQALALALTMLGLALANHAQFRFDMYHIWPFLTAATPVLATAPLICQKHPLRLLANVLAAAALFVIAVLGSDHVRGQARLAAIPLASVRGGGVFVPAEYQNYNEVLEAVRMHTRPGDYIFSGATRHDRIHINDALMYFLTDRRIPVPYHELNRGLIVTRPIQSEIVSALESHRVRLLVLLDLDSTEPNLSAISSGVDLLDAYIRANFERHAVVGRHQIWLRR